MMRRLASVIPAVQRHSN